MLFLAAWTFIIWFVSRKNADAALKVLDATKLSYQKQIDSINETYEKEITERDKALHVYNNVLKQIEDDNKRASQQLEFQKRARIKEIVDEYHNDSHSLNKTLLDEFGFEYVE
jgi:t-SNARE complex subunit (syntaxin)